MPDYKVYKPTTQELETISKFSLICDRMFIENDKITVVNAKIDNKGGVTGIEGLAILELKQPHSFEEKIGFFKISQFLSVIKKMANYEVRIYDKFVYVVDLDNKFKIKMFLTPEETNVIPYTDVMSKFDRGYINPDSTRFSLDWKVINDAVGYQKLLSKKSLYFYSKDGETVSIKIADDFENDRGNMAEIDIVQNIQHNNLEKFKDGGYVRAELNIASLIEDTYEFTILDRAVLLKGLEHDTKYLILAKI